MNLVCFHEENDEERNEDHEDLVSAPAGVTNVEHFVLNAPNEEGEGVDEEEEDVKTLVVKVEGNHPHALSLGNSAEPQIETQEEQREHGVEHLQDEDHVFEEVLARTEQLVRVGDQKYRQDLAPYDEGQNEFLRLYSIN